MFKGYFFLNPKDSEGCTKFKENPLFIVILTTKVFFWKLISCNSEYFNGVESMFIALIVAICFND